MHAQTRNLFKLICVLGGLLKCLCFKWQRNKYKKPPAWKTSIKAADKQWIDASQVDDNLNFSLIYFHVLFLFFFSYLLSLFYFPSPSGAWISPLPLCLSPPSLPGAHYSGTDASAVFQHSEIITRPATALVSTLVNHRSGQGEAVVGRRLKQSAPGSAMKMFILYSSIASSREINLHHVSVTVPRQQRWYERGGRLVLRGRQRTVVDSFR